MDRESTMSVLVVDDDNAVRTTVAMVLRVNGYEVNTAADGFDALEKIRIKVPDVLFSDLQMPQMSGFELLSVVRRRFPGIRVIACSGAYDGPEVPSGVLADAFYSKGRASAEELLALFREVVAADLPDRDQKHAAIWIPRNGRDHNGIPFVVLNCIECLRAFPFTVDREPGGEVESTPCIYCPNEIFFIVDFSRSVSSPATRAEWRRTFLRSQKGLAVATMSIPAKDPTVAPFPSFKLGPVRM